MADTELLTDNHSRRIKELEREVADLKRQLQDLTSAFHLHQSNHAALT